MAQKILLLGGSRSGKSSRAEAFALDWPQDKRIYVATYQDNGEDPEMLDRIKRHQEKRGPHWKTIEVDHRLSELLQEHNNPSSFILVDCLTLWLSSQFLIESNPLEIEKALVDLAQTVKEFKGSLILVSNELGSGLVPFDKESRAFRDASGMMNQMIAAEADHVEVLVAGLPQVLKGSK